MLSRLPSRCNLDYWTTNFVVTNRFLAQTIGRLSTGYPISLLELHTVLHALCCFAIYAAWWHKPLDIEQPSLIDVSSAKLQQLATWMLMDSETVLARIQCHKIKPLRMWWVSSEIFPRLIEDIPAVSDIRKSKLEYAQSKRR